MKNLREVSFDNGNVIIKQITFTPTSETAKQEVLEYAKENLSIDDAKKILERNGYFVANLWHTDDVTINYKCDEDTAQGILFDALTNEFVMSSIFEAIHIAAEQSNIEPK
jgi:hypothetical protein